MKRVRITNDSINSYGTRILTSGMDTVQYEKNPVLLYMHQRGKVIGYMKDLQRNGSEVTGEPVFDEATELSVQCKKQWECGSLRMVSVGIDILEMSDAAEDVAPGQFAPTVTKSKLSEVSVVDIGSNDDAIQLMKNGQVLTLGKGSTNPLPTLQEYHSNNNQTNKTDMELKKIALAMGMAETSDEASVLAAVQELTAAKEKLATMEKQLADMECRAVTDAVEEAIAEKRLDPSKKGHFVELGKKVGSETLKETLKAMHPQAKLSSLLPGGDGAPGHRTYAKLSEVPAKEMMELRSKQPEEYARLYKAEYGMDIEL